MTTSTTKRFPLATTLLDAYQHRDAEIVSEVAYVTFLLLVEPDRARPRAESLTWSTFSAD